MTRILSRGDPVPGTIRLLSLTDSARREPPDTVLPIKAELMAYDEHLAQRVRRKLARRKNIEEKKMFGGVGFLLNGNMCVGIWKNSLIARVGPDQYESALRELGAAEFDITGRPMTGWVMIDPQGIEADDLLREWIQRATKFVRTLPAK